MFNACMKWEHLEKIYPKIYEKFNEYEPVVACYCVSDPVFHLSQQISHHLRHQES